MRFFGKTGIGALLAASILSMPALAQEKEAGADSPVSLSGSVTLVSDYRFRGVSRSNGKVALQPTLTVSHDNGLYAGVWGSTLPDSPLHGQFELDLYAGYATEIASRTSIDIGATYYAYPGNRDWAGPSDYVELTGKLSHDIGPLSATGTVAYLPDQASVGGDNLYLNLGFGAGVPNTPVTLNAGIGYTDGSLSPSAFDSNYFDWSIGASYFAGPATLSVQYVDTDVRKTGIRALDRRYDPSLIFSIGVSF